MSVSTNRFILSAVWYTRPRTRAPVASITIHSKLVYNTVSLQPTELALDTATQIFGIAQQHSHCHALKKFAGNGLPPYSPTETEFFHHTSLVPRPNFSRGLAGRARKIWCPGTRLPPHPPTLTYLFVGVYSIVTTSNPNSLTVNRRLEISLMFIFLFKHKGCEMYMYMIVATD